MVPLIDLTGKKFGMLTVVGRAPNRKGRTMWKCKCDCGNIVDVEASNLKSGHTTSCGCYWYERVPSINHEKNVRHGETKTRLHHIWANMRYRCNNPKCHQYDDYGGRGIKVCEEWSDYEAFRDWALNNGYSDDLSVDRIDVDGDYEPSNCRWADNKTQSNNKRDSRKITYNGETHTIAEWSRITGISWVVIDYRIKSGWSIEKTLTKAP